MFFANDSLNKMIRSMNEAASPIQYNLIICRYNEIGLKSRKVRSRMEQRLVSHIKKICKRENLSIVHAQREWGRFIFEFSLENMPKALKIFKYIIGLHSFSPAISVDSSNSSIIEKVKDFATADIKSGDSFVIRARRVKSHPKTSLEIEREMGEVVLDTAAKLGREIFVKMKNPTKTIYIEVREAATYFFSKKINTIWGGNPIEIDKPVIALWRGDFNDTVAAQLMLRRGSIIFPIIFFDEKNQLFNSPKTMSSAIEEIKLIAKYLPEPITVLQLDLHSLGEYLNQISDESVKNILLAYSTMYLLDNLGKEVNFNRELRFNSKDLWIKGILTSFRLTDSLYCALGQNLTIPHFMPIIGLSNEMIQDVQIRLNMTSSQTQNDEFTVADIVLNHQNGDSFSKIKPESHQISIIKDIKLILEKNVSSELIILLDSIVNQRQKILVQGSIL
ncbi:tRNA sulfurtransferase [Candidatus Lokiarchaeum ossiferum]